MTDYTKLVEALRYCAESGDFNCNKDCPMYPNYPKCLTKMDMDAAAAIEALQAEVKILKVSGREAYFEGLAADAEPKLGKWVRVEDEESYHYECSRCGERPLYNRYGDVVLSGVCPMCGKKMEVQDGK